MKPLKITAILQTGFVSNDPWSPSIDGIFGYYYFKEKLGEENFSITQGYSGSNENLDVVDNLPFLKERYKDLWWYCVSKPFFDLKHENYSKFVHRRFDTQFYDFLGDNIRRINISSGRLKNYRIELRRKVVEKIEWHVIGDETEIRSYLNKINFVGKYVKIGEGKILGWGIDEGNENFARYYRPLPIEFAKEKNLYKEDMLTMNWGIVPPGRLERNKILCVMPI